MFYSNKEIEKKKEVFVRKMCILDDRERKELIG